MYVCMYVCMYVYMKYVCVSRISCVHAAMGQCVCPCISRARSVVRVSPCGSHPDRLLSCTHWQVRREWPRPSSPMFTAASRATPAS